MKKVVLILAAVLTLVACKNKNQKDNGSTQSILIDTTNVCYQKSFVFDIQYTMNSGKNDTLRHISNQPNFNQCQNGKWCLVDAKTSNVIASDVKSYKVLSHYFDTIQYVSCCEMLIILKKDPSNRVFLYICGMKVLNIKKELSGEKLLENCIEGFDFLKVHMVMSYLDWRWAHIGATPNMTQMRSWVKELSESLLKHMKENPKQRNFSSSSGGFEIIFTRSYEGCEPDSVEIKFVLESWDHQVLEAPL